MNGDALLKIARNNPDVEVDESGSVPPSSPAIKTVSRMEQKFHDLWTLLDGPELTQEHRFHDTRRWRLDFAHIPTMTAIELEGGVWGGGRHNRAPGFIADCDKYNAAALQGWTVFRLATGMVTTTTLQEIIDYIKEATHE